MANRPTIEQLATAAGVSVATADRVLNGRAHVRLKTARRVHEAAIEIGYHASGLIHQRIMQELPEYRLGFLLLNTAQTLHNDFARHLEEAVAQANDIRGVFTLDRASPSAPEEIAAKLTELSARCMAVAIMAPEHPSVTAAVLSCAKRSVPVFALQSDVAVGMRHAYVGVHNGKMGRTAAWMIANSARRHGKVALFAGNPRFQGHEARAIGFRAFFREEAPSFTLLETPVNIEDPRFTRDRILDLSERHQDLAGCYLADGDTEGAIAAMRALSHDRRPVMICNNLTAMSTAALADRSITMVLDTPVRAICREVVRLMAHSLSTREAGREDCFLPFGIHLPESV